MMHVLEQIQTPVNIANHMVVGGDEVLDRYLAANPKAAEEWRQTRKLRDDPRVCSVAKLLRKSSLDELPQLFNVLRGDMSLVGPRPIVDEEIQRYGVHFVLNPAHHWQEVSIHALSCFSAEAMTVEKLA